MGNQCWCLNVSCHASIVNANNTCLNFLNSFNKKDGKIFFIFVNIKSIFSNVKIYAYLILLDPPFYFIKFLFFLFV